MTIYVDELPKSCDECPCCSGDQYCNYMWENYTDTEKPHFDECNLKDYCKVPYDFNNNMTRYKEWLDNLPKNNYEQYKTCPLQSLADYNKQVRKEVIEQVKHYMENHSHTIPVNTKNRKVVYKIGLTRFLDKMQELEQDNK